MANLREFHRGKNAGVCRDVKVGDVVLVFDENKKRVTFWKMGKIEGLVTGTYEVRRGTTVRVIRNEGKLRSVQKLYLVELSVSEQDTEKCEEGEVARIVKQVEQELPNDVEISRCGGSS